MKIKFLKYLILLFCFYSCGFEKLGEWKISTLYAQKIQGTSKVLYKYDAWGGRDSNANGFVILDSSDTFKIDLQNELPFYNLSDIPNKTKIVGITHDCYNSCGSDYYKSKPIFYPMKIEKSLSNDIHIETIIYQYRGYSEKAGGLERYVFEKFAETKDSLFFYDLNDVESMNGIHLDELRIKKGEIYLLQNENKEVEKIIAKQKTLNPKTKEFIDGRTCSLTPKNKILSNKFSERGIFREVKIKENNN
ncbi:hypothetical protein [Chryseobacterium sp. FH1]|uniref:hypothetical protein n=1 Tax=Chryseobacterium sp. FH1 TaxID=1233951 RepID=UPI0004E3539F|nr:hypothetical protein [Chryseobacterium sp. FH1]KFC18700.1 hypothetical protein IO90_17010 [Chryseobacterium sp. FH1]